MSIKVSELVISSPLTHPNSALCTKNGKTSESFVIFTSFVSRPSCMQHKAHEQGSLFVDTMLMNCILSGQTSLIISVIKE